jgi:hypothetical protein
MKKIAVNALGLRRRLFKKMSQIKSAGYPALFARLGVYGGELPPFSAPIPIRRRPT